MTLALQLLAVGAALYYAILREQYRVFYDYFRVAPEDVGVTSAQVLIDSATGIGVLFAVAMVIAVPVGLAYGLMLRSATVSIARVLIRMPPWRRLGHPPTDFLKDRRTGPILRRLVVVTAFVLPLAAVLLILVTVLRSEASEAGKCAAAGRSIRGLTIFGLPVLGIRALEAEITWLADSSGLPTFGGRVMYLGANDGTAVVYDVAAQEPVRFPASDAVVRISNAPRIECPG